MLKRIIGGAISLVSIGGTVFALSQPDIVSNFSDNTGMTQEQAQEYINNIPEDDLTSFASSGQGLIEAGNSIIQESRGIDCVKFAYEWETPLLSCQNGKTQCQAIGNNLIELGTCYKSLDTDLGNLAKAKIGECISDIDTVNADLKLPIAIAVMRENTITENRNTNNYNKSVLEAALESE